MTVMKNIVTILSVFILISSVNKIYALEFSEENPFKIHKKVPADTSYPNKPITVLLYGSARNDLLPFIDRNLKQLMQVGSNDNITFLVHLDVFGQGRKKLTQRYIVMKNYMIQVGDDMSMDSGDAATLMDACNWAFSKFPSDRAMLILWNHGTGDIEPSWGRAINSIELFQYNSETNLIELNRSINFFDYLNEQQIRMSHRGICFDEATGNYLTNQQVGSVLRNICATCRNGQPLDMILCDACLMQGIGVAYSLKPLGQMPVAHYMVGSQEVVLATGYSYNTMFEKLANNPTMTNSEFAAHVVQAFADSYSRITNDYTQSAINLDAIDPLYISIDTIAQLLIFGMQNETNRSVHKFIQKSSSPDECTYFEEPTYKDIKHLLNNMLNNISHIKLKQANDTQQLLNALGSAIADALNTLDQIIVANNVGKNLKNARGISIYLPSKRVDGSFPKSDFGLNNNWLKMILMYVGQ